MNYTEEDKQNILSVLTGAKKSGRKGWYSAKCPYCGKEEHLGVVFTETISFNCFRCGEKGTAWKLLKFLGKLFLIKKEKLINIFQPLEVKTFEKVKISKEDFILPKKSKPLGFKRCLENDYLINRGLSQFQVERYEWGITNLESKYKNYILLLLYFENKLIGYIGRTTLQENEIKKIESLEGKKYKRYINSIDTDFSRYLFGIEDIKEQTKTVILVEGIFDKLNIDNLLQLDDSDDLKCLSCFGKKISEDQIFLLQKKNIKNIIFLYDKDAIHESKKYAIQLLKFFNVKVAYCTKKDPGDLVFDQLSEILNKVEDPINFSINKVHKKLK